MNKVAAGKNEHSVYVTGEILGQDGKESGGRNNGRECVEEGLRPFCRGVATCPVEHSVTFCLGWRVFRSSKLDS